VSSLSTAGELKRAPRLALRFVLTVIVGLAVCGISITYLTRSIFLNVEKGSTASDVQLVAQIVMDTSLHESDFRRVTPTRRRELDRLLQRRVLSQTILAAALYGPDGRLAYSTDARTLGRATTDSTFATAALGQSRISTRTTSRPKLLEYGIPVRYAIDRPIGTIVIAVDYAEVATAAARKWIPIAVALELLVGLLFIGLVPTIRRALGQSREHLRDAQSHALHDTLTGLPNRRLYEDRVKQAIALAQRNHGSLAVMLIDLDRFKEINDTLGHAAGDVMLRETAVRLAEVLRETDTVARLGGDEFAIVLGDGTLSAVHETAVRIQQAIEAPVEHDGLVLSVGASVGIAIYPEHGKNTSTLLRNADVAMYQAKRAGLGHVVFDPGSTSRDEEDRSLTTDLGGALARGEILLHYQPTVAIATQEVVGVEALLRWNHPAQGLLAADRFMPLAEAAGVRTEIYDFALADAIRQAGEWQRAGLGISVAINLDPRTLADRELPTRFERLLAEHGVDGEQLEAEISEASLLGDIDRVSGTAVQLAALGVRLVVDDFGADYSALNSLAYLPVEKLKIDRALLNRALGSRRERIVLTGITELAHNLGLGVVVAGVEDDEALELVAEIGVDTAQGYLLGAPMSPTAIGGRLTGVPA
jgi:diguanylate cyclase (GGDEF)-like protein